MNIQPPKRVNRTSGRRMAVKAFSLPLPLVREIERLAALDYGDNQSALVTEKLCEALHIPVPDAKELEAA